MADQIRLTPTDKKGCRRLLSLTRKQEVAWTITKDVYRAGYTIT
jgi:hypothetical protein